MIQNILWRHSWNLSKINDDFITLSTVTDRFWGPVVCFKLNFTFIVDLNKKG